eukprot:COSAG02_NODE_4738_length_5037_cov_3.804172_3_plen_753_part_00
MVADANAVLSALLCIAGVGVRGVPWPNGTVEAPEQPSAMRLLVSATILLLAMLSKAAAVPVPAVLVCVDLVVIVESSVALKRAHTNVWIALWTTLRRNAPALLAALIGAMGAANANPANQIGHTELDTRATFLRACYSFWCYPLMSFLPTGMSIRYRAHRDNIVLTDPRFGLAACASVLLLAWLLLIVARLACPPFLVRYPVGQRELRAGAVVGAYLVTVLPTLGFVQHGDPLLGADRYTYLPALLIGIPVVAVVVDSILTECRVHRRAIYGVVVGAVSVYMGLSREYSTLFANRELLWRHAVALDPCDSGAVNQLGLALETDGRHAEAVPLFDTATEIYPGFADAWNHAGVSLLELSRLEEALSRWDTAMRVHKHHRDAWLNRGLAYERYGRLAEASHDYKNVLAVHPDCANAWYNYGSLKLKLGLTSEAETLLRSSIRLQPRHPDFYNNLGNSMRGEPARNKEALYSYSSAIALKPTFLGARSNKASLLASMQRHNEAVTEYTAVLNLDPSYKQARVARGNAYLVSNQLDHAEADYRYALSYDPQSVSELNNLCLVLHRLNRLEEAQITCRDAIAVDGAHAWSWYNLGTTQYKMGVASSGDVAAQSQLYDASISSYRRALKDQPGAVSVWESLHKVLESAGRMAESRDSANRASALRQSLLVAEPPHPAHLPHPPPPLPSPPLARHEELLAVSADEVVAHLARLESQAKYKIRDQQSSAQDASTTKVGDHAKFASAISANDLVNLAAKRK